MQLRRLASLNSVSQGNKLETQIRVNLAVIILKSAGQDRQAGNSGRVSMLQS
jgi:hypothetical protein